MRLSKKDKDIIKEFNKDRDEAILSFDVDMFKAFYFKWKARGFYEIDLPKDDHIIEITMRKMVFGMRNPPKDKVKEAGKWLIEHGYDLYPFGGEP